MSPSSLQASIYEELFITSLKSVIKEGFSLEVIQCLIAIPGILAAAKDTWSLRSCRSAASLHWQILQTADLLSDFANHFSFALEIL
jgi:hypothetical protein